MLKRSFVPRRLVSSAKRFRWASTRISPYVEAIRQSGAQLIVLAGFMRVLKSTFLDAFAGRIINLHPSLLPSFKGLDAIGQAWDYGVKVTGCTVHWVNAEIDGGAILGQEVVRIEADDTKDSLAEKVHAAEHQLLPAVVRQLAANPNQLGS